MAGNTFGVAATDANGNTVSAMFTVSTPLSSGSTLLSCHVTNSAPYPMTCTVKTATGTLWSGQVPANFSQTYTQAQLNGVGLVHVSDVQGMTVST